MLVRSSAAFRLFIGVAVLSLGGAFALAQNPAPAAQKTQEAAAFPDTPEGRMKKFDLAEDPGLDPAPGRTFIRYGQQYRVEKFEKRWAKMDIGRPGWIRPFGYANIEKELYRQDDKFVWVWYQIEEAAAPTPERFDERGETIRTEKLPEASINYYREIKPEFVPVSVPQKNVSINFELSSEGLPTTGSWRNSFDVADMNGDGNLDILVPPQRGPGGSPAIFLGDGTGKWKRWEGTSYGKLLSYGSAVAGDVNGDRRMDVVIGAHISGVFAFLGDGKGNFTESSKGLPLDFGTRRVTLSDVDRDGDLDIIAISEGPMDVMNSAPRTMGSKLKVFFNNGKGTEWKEQDIADPYRQLSGDYLSAGDFNGDKYPDFISASIYYNGPDILYVSNGKKGWDPVGRGTLIPFLSLYGATGSGKFSSKRADDALVAYSRSWPAEVDPGVVEPPESKQVMGIDRITWQGKNPVRKPVIRWSGENRVWGMTTADFDGDGKLDIAYTVQEPRAIEVLLGDGKGGFSRARVLSEGLLKNVNYDLRAADVNKDGRPDLVIMYESSEALSTRGKNGAIQVFLNRAGGK